MPKTSRGPLPHRVITPSPLTTWTFSVPPIPQNLLMPALRSCAGCRVALAAVAVTLAVGTLCATPASAQRAAAGTWPERPVRLIVPFAAGGAADRTARVIGERLGAAFGTQFVADNRPGAGGGIGFELLGRAAPDGYTLATGSDSMTLLPYSQKGLTWDPRAFTPISLITTQPLVIAVHTSVPATTLKEFIALARAKPGHYAYGTSGHGHPQHLTGEMIKRAGGFDMTHVPYKGGGAAITDLIGGQIPVVVLGSSPAIPHHRAGKIRILAVTTAKRSPALPDVPTLEEAGVRGIDVAQWIGLIGPPKLPRDLVTRLNSAVVQGLAHAPTREALEAAGFDAAPSTPEQLGIRVRETMARWERLLKDVKVTFE
jgi:tripartite-type tricarboxylate transporter receptor subunit TctC